MRKESDSSPSPQGDPLGSLLLKSVLLHWEKVAEDSYLRGISALSCRERIDFTTPVTFFAGENGSGKSTLLEAIAIAYGFNPEGGTRNFRFSTYDSCSDLSSAITLSRGPVRAKGGYFLRAESFYNVATQEEDYSRGPGGRPLHLHKRSHGESFLLIAQNYFGQRGLYLLDEPEAALSPQRQLTLLREISASAGEGSQFIIATHSPLLLGLPGATILSFEEGGLRPIPYEETESYQITELFINHRKQLLKNLL